MLTQHPNVNGSLALAPSPDSLIERARSLREVFAERAAGTEAQGRISADSIDRLEGAGLFGLLRPARFGGFEYDLGVLMDVVFEIGRGCASTSWVYGLFAAHHYLLALFPLEAQEDVWGAGNETRVAGSYAPAATARIEGGAYRVSGRWSFASGVDNAEWAFLGVLFPPTDGGAPRPGFLLVPASDYTIEDDWDTVGLRGTGSKTVVIADARVPAHRTLGFRDMLNGTTPGSHVHRNAIYRLPFIATTPISILAAGFGAAQGAIDAFLEQAATRTTRGATVGAGGRIADFSSVQIRFAEATAALDAAKVLVRRDLDETLALVENNEEVPIAMRIRNRRDHGFAMTLAVRAVDAIFASVGGQGLTRGNPIQRAWRDVHAVAKHVSFNWDAVGTMYGQHAFDLEPKGQY